MHQRGSIEFSEDLGFDDSTCAHPQTNRPERAGERALSCAVVYLPFSVVSSKDFIKKCSSMSRSRSSGGAALSGRCHDISKL